LDRIASWKFLQFFDCDLVRLLKLSKTIEIFGKLGKKKKEKKEEMVGLSQVDMQV